MPPRRVTFKEVRTQMQSLATNAPQGPAKKTLQAYANFLKKFPQEFGADADDSKVETTVNGYGVTVPPKQW